MEITFIPSRDCRNEESVEELQTRLTAPSEQRSASDAIINLIASAVELGATTIERVFLLIVNVSLFLLLSLSLGNLFNQKFAKGLSLRSR